MHREVGWMKPADTYILDFMASTDAKLKPASIALNVPYSANWVGQRCRELTSRGLLENFPDDGAYKITEKGKQVAEREIDAEDLED
ncbi:hypothetical protein ACFQO4_20495 [Saliphagus sp. GCM10025334]